MHPSDGFEETDSDAPPVWTAFGDLMACLFGLFVLFFVGLVSMQVSLAEDLEASRAEADEATARLETLESALAGPLAAGLITLVDGRIGIRGSVLFDLSSAELRPAGRRLLRQLAPPIRTYLERHQLAIMVSGFTDDLALRPEGDFADNWELSTERALTVTRELVAAGIPPEQLVAAGFGEHHPIVPNDTEEHRAQNRRVEIAPIPLPEALRAEARPSDPEPAPAAAPADPIDADVDVTLASTVSVDVTP
jgi:outer membrane protein OmpA-like peptidoglycan-associated protein